MSGGAKGWEVDGGSASTSEYCISELYSYRFAQMYISIAHHLYQKYQFLIARADLICWTRGCCALDSFWDYGYMFTISLLPGLVCGTTVDVEALAIISHSINSLATGDAPER